MLSKIASSFANYLARTENAHVKHCEREVRYFFLRIRLYFLIPKRSRKYSLTNSYIFAMALFFTQDDHLTAGAWAACGQVRLLQVSHFIRHDQKTHVKQD